MTVAGSHDDRTSPTRKTSRRWTAAAVVGGVLWSAYGVFEFLAPLGVDAVYDVGRGYEVVVDRPLFVSYTLPGVLALLLTSTLLLRLASLRQPVPAGAGAARVLCWAAIAAAVLGLGGVIAAFDPVATGARVLGSVLLGVGCLLTARGAAGFPRSWVLLLVATGVLGLLLLPLWPLVYAVGLVSPAGGTVVLTVFGLLWVLLGLQQQRASTIVRSAKGSRSRCLPVESSDPEEPIDPG